MTNGDGTWDIHLTMTWQTDETKIPHKSLTPAYEGHTEWLFSHTVDLGGIILARRCFSLDASVEYAALRKALIRCFHTVRCTQC